MIIPRERLISIIDKTLERYPVVLLIGPRQCGKTTIALEIRQRKKGSYFDLEDPDTPLQAEVAKITLKDLRGLVIIDEFQYQPELFSLLRVLTDRKPMNTQFLILGSASPDLVKGVSETLAGRVAYIDMGPFSLLEISENSAEQLWLRGGFPESYLKKDNEDSFNWRSNFIRSFLERDIPQLGIRVPAYALRRFWMMVAHFHGQVWNASEFARSLGSTEKTARHYLDILSGSFMVRQLPPWFENIGKRLVKSPKVYIRDTGILHTLFGLRTKEQIQSHPKMGLSWEGFALEQILLLTGLERDAYYYRTQAGAELDLLLHKNGKRYGFEFKYQDAPRTSKSMHIVLDDLKLNKLWVVYPGDRTYALTESIEIVSLKKIREILVDNELCIV